ncbi:MAG: exodeoxyribonuclease I [Pseudohongiellaceae bacterium]
MSDNTIYWYDFETFGIDPRRDRASQFAGIRTDEDLNIISKPLLIYCKPADDFLPDPMACLITGISPQKALDAGICEAEFIQRIEKEFSQPGTCVAGYNSIRFDDELTRQLLYRNFYDPYEREWKNGNSRWDIIDMVRLCAAIRPEGINWPLREDGSTSFRLEQLTKENGIEHADAHDALSDVIATIEMAKLVKRQQAKLYEYVYKLRNKRAVQSEIDMVTRKPLLHVSMMYPAKQGALALVMPFCQHPANSNGIIVYDLRVDPDCWSELSVDAIRERIFTSKEELETGKERIPFKTLHINKCPVVCSPAVLSPQRAEQFGIDLDACKQHWSRLKDSKGLVAKIQQVFSEELGQGEADPDYMIYSGGFFSQADKNLMAMIRSTSAHDLARLDLPFRDSRLATLLQRYRARNFKDTLDEKELEEWNQFRKTRVCSSEALAKYEQGYAEARQRAGGSRQDLFDSLDEYVAAISIFPETSA